ncbi:MAG: HAD hydrolase-like protein [bacterium]|nr:HAD hydrolase-like protein [bacterium]
MIKAVLFDVDGVLVNAKRFSQILQEDYNLTTETTLSFFSQKFMHCLVGKADLKEEITPYLKEWKIDKTPEEFLEYWFTSEHKIDEELIRYIKTLKRNNIKVYVVTNQEKYRTNYIVNKMGFGSIFDDIFSSADLEVTKSEQIFFQKVLQKLENIKADEILLWDDEVKHIEIAKKSGLLAEVYTDFENFKKKMASYITFV